MPARNIHIQERSRASSVFVDESKRQGLVLVGVRVDGDDLAKVRSDLRQLLLPQQSHLHFTRESEGRRRSIVDALCGANIRASIYVADPADHAVQARTHCLRALIAHCAETNVGRVVIEEDESLRRHDQAVLFGAVRDLSLAGSLVYSHARKRTEPLLWAADAIAWCWTHRAWRPRIHPLVDHVADLKEG